LPPSALAFRIPSLTDIADLFLIQISITLGITLLVGIVFSLSKKPNDGLLKRKSLLIGGVSILLYTIGIIVSFALHNQYDSIGQVLFFLLYVLIPLAFLALLDSVFFAVVARLWETSPLRALIFIGCLASIFYFLHAVVFKPMGMVKYVKTGEVMVNDMPYYTYQLVRCTCIGIVDVDTCYGWINDNQCPVIDRLPPELLQYPPDIDPNHMADYID